MGYDYTYDWQTRELAKDQADWEAYCALSNSMKRLGDNFYRVGVMAALGHARYTKGFSDGALLREFCEEYTPEPYMPVGDTRPTAERLGWPRLS